MAQGWCGNIPDCFSAPRAAGRLPVEGEEKGLVSLREPGSLPLVPPLQARYIKMMSLGMMKPKWKEAALVLHKRKQPAHQEHLLWTTG